MSSVCRSLWNSEGITGTGVIGHFKLPCGCWALDLLLRECNILSYPLIQFSTALQLLLMPDKHLPFPELLENTPTILLFLLFYTSIPWLVAKAYFWPHTVCSVKFYFFPSKDTLQSAVCVYNLTFKPLVTLIYTYLKIHHQCGKCHLFFRKTEMDFGDKGNLD